MTARNAPTPARRQRITPHWPWRCWCVPQPAAAASRRRRRLLQRLNAPSRRAATQTMGALLLLAAAPGSADAAAPGAPQTLSDVFALASAKAFKGGVAGLLAGVAQAPNASPPGRRHGVRRFPRRRPTPARAAPARRSPSSCGFEPR